MEMTNKAQTPEHLRFPWKTPAAAQGEAGAHTLQGNPCRSGSQVVPSSAHNLSKMETY